MSKRILAKKNLAQDNQEAVLVNATLLSRVRGKEKTCSKITQGGNKILLALDVARTHVLVCIEFTFTQE